MPERLGRRAIVLACINCHKKPFGQLCKRALPYRASVDTSFGGYVPIAIGLMF